MRVKAKIDAGIPNTRMLEHIKPVLSHGQENEKFKSEIDKINRMRSGKGSEKKANKAEYDLNEKRVWPSFLAGRYSGKLIHGGFFIKKGFEYEVSNEKLDALSSWFEVPAKTKEAKTKEVD